jgi:hypothetical protein
MAYDRSGATILPNAAATGAALDAALDFCAKAGTEANAAGQTMPCKGRILGLAYIVSEVVACATTAGVLSLQIDDVEVMTIPIVDEEALNTWYFKLGTLASDQTGEFAAGQALKVEVKTACAEGGAETGQGQVFLIVALDQGP